MKPAAGAVTWRAPQSFYRRKTWVWHATVFGFFGIAVTMFMITRTWGGVVVAVLLYWVFLAKADDKPRVIDYRLNRDGLTIDGQLIRLSEIHSFELETYRHHSILVVYLNYPMSFPLNVVVNKRDLGSIRSRLRQEVPERSRFSFIRWLTHWLNY